MAGGHAYEVLNVRVAKDILGGLGLEVPSPEGRAWFTQPSVLKFITGDSFTVKLTEEQAVTAIAEHVTEDAKRAILLKKARDSADLRLFVPAFLTHLGPDFSHISDWLHCLEEWDPRMLRKLSKVTVPTAVMLADRWTARMARRAARATGQGVLKEVVETPAGRLWIELLDETALVRETAMMKHCVYGYAKRLEAGTRIFSLRDHHGHASVTTEALVTDEATHVGQIRCFDNAIPGSEYRADIATLLNHLTLDRDFKGEAAAAGLCRGESGQWQFVTDVAERLVFDGQACLGYNKILFLMSPVHPDIPIASAGYTTTAWWRQESGFYGSLLLRACGERRLSLEEQRAVAKLASHLDYGTAHLQFRFLVGQRDGFIPWADTCTRRDVAGLECLVDTNSVIHLPRAHDVTHVLTSANKSGTDFKLLPLEEGREWSAEDVRRVARFLTALGIKTIKYGEDGGLKKSGLCQCTDNTWARFDDYAVKHVSPVIRPNGRPWTWYVVPWCAELRDGDRPLVSLMCDMSGKFLTSIMGSISDEIEMGEAARMANKMGLLPSEDWRGETWVKPSRWHNTYFAGRQPTTVFPVGNTWHACLTVEQVCQHLASAFGRRAPKDRILVETGCSLLPLGHSPEADKMLARCLSAWVIMEDKAVLKRADGPPVFNLMPLKAGPDRYRVTSYERLVDAAALSHLMTGSAMKHFARAAELHIRGTIGRTKRPRDLFGASQARVRRLLTLFSADLNPKVFDRALPWMFSFGIGLLVDVAGEDRQRVDITMLDMLDCLPHHTRAVHAIRDAARHSIYSLTARPDKVLPHTGAEAMAWARCVEAMHPTWWSEHNAASGQELCDHCRMHAASADPEDKAQWHTAAARLEVVLAAYAEVERLRDERRKAWEDRQTHWAGPLPTVGLSSHEGARAL